MAHPDAAEAVGLLSVDASAPPVSGRKFAKYTTCIGFAAAFIVLVMPHLNYMGNLQAIRGFTNHTDSIQLNLAASGGNVTRMVLKVGGDRKLGVHIKCTKTGVVISKVYETGAIPDWNKENKDRSALPDDTIVSVHSKETPMAKGCDDIMDALGKACGSKDMTFITLVLPAGHAFFVSSGRETGVSNPACFFDDPTYCCYLNSFRCAANEKDAKLLSANTA